ncbi:hypothetical protein [Dyadobacter fanqingshengii]|uniref:Uncharacterized protein n=1 Tax=Dyadobacter fanqingshengii TaxID=2906443 RepID=A0A9X1P9S8_9BACT|nr:hypothetical protein [Dyadobacter fanqingshengii]MCF0041341.1 hypothetical protein [Dyadobacter fanqingshengii]USJ36936.1 hypothetical protein NFI81_03995 [Dyadobacter fanqingshengii]
MTVLLAFLLSLLFYESTAQKNLAYAGQTYVQHDAPTTVASLHIANETREIMVNGTPYFAINK